MAFSNHHPRTQKYRENKYSKAVDKYAHPLPFPNSSKEKYSTEYNYSQE